MGEIGTIKPAALITGITYAETDHCDTALEELGRVYGTVANESQPFSFDAFSAYYAEEMGQGLHKRFVAFERPVLPDRLASIKHETNEIEHRMVRGEPDDRRRTVNIDPGYVTLAKLVLASTKNNIHRIYIGDGIFAEVTLVFRGGAFKPLSTTYPDYSSAPSLAFFDTVRELVKRNRTAWASKNT